jgi:hypothetical protein
MISRWARPALAPLALGIMLAGGAAPAQGQRARELGIGAVVTASDPALGAAMVYGALRTSRRMRISAAAGAGVSDGRAAWRGELLAHFLLSPQRTQGVGWYGAGGIAAVGGPVEQGYLVLTLGVEARPAGREGWFVEGGVGGGARLAAGYRWRRFATTEARP